MTQLHHQYLQSSHFTAAACFQSMHGMHGCRHAIQMCEWFRVDELQQQEATIRVAMDIASAEKHKVLLRAVLLMALCCH